MLLSLSWGRTHVSFQEEYAKARAEGAAWLKSSGTERLLQGEC